MVPCSGASCLSESAITKAVSERLVVSFIRIRWITIIVSQSPAEQPEQVSKGESRKINRG